MPNTMYHQSSQSDPCRNRIYLAAGYPLMLLIESASLNTENDGIKCPPRRMFVRDSVDSNGRRNIDVTK